VSDERTSYILRIKDELERQLLANRSIYVGITRDWLPRTRVLFVKNDAFSGSGIIDRFVAIDDLQEPERKLCIENNWYVKIVFERLARFVPPVPVQDTPAANQNRLSLHGASISSSEALQIEGLANAKIIT
jgi:hypothetical protein